MANAQGDLDAGDEARHTGDRVGFPHAVSDGTALEDAGLDEGVPVTFDGTDIAEVGGGTADGTEDVAGILFTLPVYGDSNYGPLVRGDRDATVAVRGQYVADLSAYVDGSATDPSEGSYVDDNGDIYVKNEIDADNNIYEVALR